jgi:hypothetical protein
MMFRIRAANRNVWLQRSDFIETVELLVSAIRTRTEHLGDPRTQAAFERWDDRTPSEERVLVLRTGLDPAALESWVSPGSTVREFWGQAYATTETRQMAAARLSQPLPTATRRALVEAVTNLRSRPTPKLDALSEAAAPALAAVADQRPYEQGHALALWLRAALDLETGPVNPGRLLAEWGVQVLDLPPLDGALDAVACWGGGAAAVLINPKGRHSQEEAGRRATLCHEIAHLLLDRGRSLPAAEVFGGSTPKHLEQRARAFAAELLLPRELAGSAVAQAESLAAARTELQSTYGVSNEVLGWQIRNGPAWDILSAVEKKRVGNWCRHWKASANN